MTGVIMDILDLVWTILVMKGISKFYVDNRVNHD